MHIAFLSLVAASWRTEPTRTIYLRRAAGHLSIAFSKARKRVTCRIQQPTKYELAINLMTAKTLRLTLPDNLLVAAKR